MSKSKVIFERSPRDQQRRRWGWDRWTCTALALLAWALRLRPALDNRFHADEALYGYWGLLIGQGRDPWLVGVPVYKPPLLPYLVASSQALFGGDGSADGEFIVRFSGLAAGLLMVPLVAALAHSLYRERTAAVMAAVGVALSPFAILFAATAFTDPVMVTLGLAACVAAARNRPGWAGLLAGLSFATKQPGLIWLPLALVIQMASCKSQVASHLDRCGRHSQFASTTAVGIRNSQFIIRNSLLIAGLAFAWDAVRVAQGAQSFWRLGVSGYGGLRFIWPLELLPRLRGWLGLAGYFFLSPILNGMLIVGLPVLVWRAIRMAVPNSEWRAITRRPYAQKSVADLALVFFSLTYFFLHWLCAFPVWDRYLLPLIPILSILLARILMLCATHVRHSSQLVTRNSQFAIRNSQLAILLFAILILPAWNAAHSRYPIGGDHWAYSGIDDAAAFLRALPEGTVVYQHWLGWHYAYYLFDAPVYLAYWPTPSWLARDVQAFGANDPRYITFPSWESSARVEGALAGVGYELEPVLAATRRDDSLSFTVYRIQLLLDE